MLPSDEVAEKSAAAGKPGNADIAKGPRFEMSAERKKEPQGRRKSSRSSEPPSGCRTRRHFERQVQTSSPVSPPSAEVPTCHPSHTTAVRMPVQALNGHAQKREVLPERQEVNRHRQFRVRPQDGQLNYPAFCGMALRRPA